MATAKRSTRVMFAASYGFLLASIVVLFYGVAFSTHASLVNGYRFPALERGCTLAMLLSTFIGIPCACVGGLLNRWSTNA